MQYYDQNLFSKGRRKKNKHFICKNGSKSQSLAPPPPPSNPSPKNPFLADTFTTNKKSFFPTIFVCISEQ